MQINFIELGTAGLDQFFILMTLAGLFGLLLGIERNAMHKTAGMRTYALVSLSAAFFVLIARTAMLSFHIDNSTIVIQFAAAIVTGVGFLGAGLILHNGAKIENVTTAAGLWMCAAIGMATGFGFIWYAATATGMTFITLRILSAVERAMRKNLFPEEISPCDNCGSCDACNSKTL
jgi:putative Mg2+ transporter-C (MgtC) family protein